MSVFRVGEDEEVLVVVWVVMGVDEDDDVV